MLHEILLSLSGHPSPILRDDSDHSPGAIILSPPERALLKNIAHLSNIHCQIIAATKAIPSTHKSGICQAVATSIKTTHLGRFQAKVLEVERSILRKDASIVGEYDVVPLTIIADAFANWTRRMDWFLAVCQFIQRPCSGPELIDHLCAAIQTGYSDIEDVALQLVKVAEAAWLRQVSAWLLYGRLPSFGADEFFIRVVQDDATSYELKKEMLPNFVTSAVASSMLFVGKSLNQIREKGISSTPISQSAQMRNLELLSDLSFPITSTGLAGVVSALRMSMSQTTLRRLLPLKRIEETLAVLHDFFLLGRGEFAVALLREADEKTRHRWRRAENSGFERRERFSDIVVKEGEVKAVLSRTWTAMAALQNTTEEEAEQLDLAREMISLNISRSSSAPHRPTSSSKKSRLAATPFSHLLLSIPTNLTLQIPSPLDLFLTSSDVQVYSHINAYLLSIKRAHTRLADLWKVTALRRSHPAPPAPPYSSLPGGRMIIRIKRAREKGRNQKLRIVWATSSAALFLLGEIEAYFQGEVVKVIWEGFQVWLAGGTRSEQSRPATGISGTSASDEAAQEDVDMWQSAGSTSHDEEKATPSSHDPQTLSLAHKSCLAALTSHLLLLAPAYTNALYIFLKHVDLLAVLVERIKSIWSLLDLESDEGLVDAFLDLHKEEQAAEEQLAEVSSQVKQAIENVVVALRGVDQDKNALDDVDLGFEELGAEEGGYAPSKVGRVDRLLMKLDFGGWLERVRGVDGDEHMDRDRDEPGDIGF